MATVNRTFKINYNDTTVPETPVRGSATIAAANVNDALTVLDDYLTNDLALASYTVELVDDLDRAVVSI